MSSTFWQHSKRKLKYEWDFAASWLQWKLQSRATGRFKKPISIITHFQFSQLAGTARIQMENSLIKISYLYCCLLLLFWFLLWLTQFIFTNYSAELDRWVHKSIPFSIYFWCIAVPNGSKVKVHWHYNYTYHNKESIDDIFGTMKNLVHRKLMSNICVFRNAETFDKHANKLL